MVKIPGWAIGLVGAAVTGYSWYVNSRLKEPSGALRIFFWIGLALLSFGVFRIVLKFIVPNHKEEVEAKTQETNERNYGDYLVCPRCKAKLHPRSRFCNWCGTKQ